MFDSVFLPDPAASGVEASLHHLLERCQHRAQDRINVQCPDPVSVQIEVCFIKDGYFNAAAQTNNGLDEIGISLGVVFILRDLFDQMLSHPEVLPQIGNPKRETHCGEYDAETSYIDVDIALRCGRRFAPSCEARRKYSSALFLTAFDFIFQHELGHIFNGHTSWLEKTLGIHALEEVGASVIPGLTGLDLQTLEMDADCFGIQDGIIRVLGGRVVDGKPQFQEHNPVYGTRMETVSAVMFAIQTTFRIFAGEPLTESIEDILSLDHPPAIFRQRYVPPTVYEVLKKQNLLTSDEEFKEALRNAVFQSERAFKLLGKPLGKDRNSSESYHLGNEFLRMLLANWKVIRPLLDQLKRGGGLAPSRPLFAPTTR